MKQPFKWGLLGLLALAQFMVVLDSSIVNVALPAIQHALQFKPSDLQWILTAYTLTFGGFLLLGGRAADLYGRRKMFIIGVAGFTVASALAGFATNSTLMILARGLQGLSAALMSPAALSIVLTSFKEGADRNKALGIWGAVAAGGAAAGVLLGGVLTQYTSWEWNFFVNIPIGIFVIAAALRIVPKHAREVAHNSLDLPGAALVTSGLITLVYTLVKAPEWGWSEPSILGLFALSASLLIGFVINEAKVKYPLVPLSIFKIRNVAGANMVQMPIMAAMLAMFFFLSLYIQTILQFSPVRTGLSFLPITIIIGITATTVSGLVGKIGFKPLLVVSPLLVGAGLFLLSHVSAAGTYLGDVLPGLALIAVGMGISFVTLTIAATSGVPGNESGLASGLLNTSQQIGGALGLAILSGIAASKTAESLQHTQNLAEATVSGFHTAFLWGMCFALVASLLALVVIKQPKGKQQHQAAPSPLH